MHFAGIIWPLRKNAAVHHSKNCAPDVADGPKLTFAPAVTSEDNGKT
jgi:hypothetical protein